MKSGELITLQRSLLSCPFCGELAKLEPKEGSRDWWQVRCPTYECGGRTWAKPSALDAANTWNRRAT
jgi:hypothetical protein